jgi:hypothetical protein
MKCPNCGEKMELSIVTHSGARYAWICGYSTQGCGYWIPCARDGSVPDRDEDKVEEK